MTDLAERMGRDHSAVSRLASGKQANPTVNTVTRSVEAIGLRVAWGLAERDDRPISRGGGAGESANPRADLGGLNPLAGPRRPSLDAAGAGGR